MDRRSPARVHPLGPPPPLKPASDVVAREGTISKAIVAKLRTIPCCSARKTHGSASGGAGWPDIVAVVDGHALMLEVKRPGGKGATELQCQELQRWYDAGAVCAVVRSVDEVMRLVELMRSQPLGPGMARAVVDPESWVPRS